MSSTTSTTIHETEKIPEDSQCASTTISLTETLKGTVLLVVVKENLAGIYCSRPFNSASNTDLYIRCQNCQVKMKKKTVQNNKMFDTTCTESSHTGATLSHKSLIQTFDYVHFCIL